MSKICHRCLLPAGGAPLHKDCAERCRDGCRDYRKLLRAGIPLWDGAIRNAVREEEWWKMYLAWEDARLSLLGKDADSHVPRTRCKPYTSIREFNLAVQEAARQRIELGPYLGEDPCLEREEVYVGAKAMEGIFGAAEHKTHADGCGCNYPHELDTAQRRKARG